MMMQRDKKDGESVFLYTTIPVTFDASLTYFTDRFGYAIAITAYVHGTKSGTG